MQEARKSSGFEVSDRISLVWQADGQLGEALAEHEQIYRCLAQRDPLLAEAAMRSHIRAAADRWVTP